MNSAAQKGMSNSSNLSGVLLKRNPQLVTVIKEISSTDLLKARAAIKNFCKIIESPEKQEVLEHYEELFIQNVVAQLNNLQQIPLKKSLAVYQPLFTILHAFVDFSSLGKTLSVACIKSLMAALLTLLADQKLNNSDDNKIINGICLKILEKTNFTYINCALIRLLRETCVGGTFSKLTELLIKAIWRNAKVLEERSNELNYDIIIIEIHNFMLALPSSFWHAQPSDTPMRAVKMIIYYMAKVKGNDILQHMQQIPKDSEFHAYLFKSLKYLQKDGSLSQDVFQHPTEIAIPEKYTSNKLTYQAVFEQFVEDHLALRQQSNVELSG